MLSKSWVHIYSRYRTVKTISIYNNKIGAKLKFPTPISVFSWLQFQLWEVISVVGPEKSRIGDRETLITEMRDNWPKKVFSICLTTEMSNYQSFRLFFPFPALFSLLSVGDDTIFIFMQEQLLSLFLNLSDLPFDSARLHVVFIFNKFFNLFEFESKWTFPALRVFAMEIQENGEMSCKW